MRLLHTSDWHLGRTLHGVDLHEAQEAVLDQLCRLVESPPDGVPVDAVLVAGDVFDRAVPPAQSVRLLERTIGRLAEHASVVVTSGNHDSAVRLGFGSTLFRDRIHIVTQVEQVGTPIVVQARPGSNEAGQVVAIHPIPWLDVDQARILLAPSSSEATRAAGDLRAAGDSPNADDAGAATLLPRSHEAVLGAAMDLVREEVAEAPAAWRHVVLAHAFVAGSEPSASERSIAVGGVDRVPGGVFDGLDYVALGHLHGPQRVAGMEHVRYCGSPLRYSFSEERQDKVALLVDLPERGPVEVTPVTIEQPRGMASLRGSLAELLEDPGLSGVEGAWVRVTVTDRVRPERFVERVRARFPHALQTLHEPDRSGLSQTASSASAASIEGDPQALGRAFIEHVTGADASETETALFIDAFERAEHRRDRDLALEGAASTAALVPTTTDARDADFLDETVGVTTPADARGAGASTSIAGLQDRGRARPSARSGRARKGA